MRCMSEELAAGVAVTMPVDVMHRAAEAAMGRAAKRLVVRAGLQREARAAMV